MTWTKFKTAALTSTALLLGGITAVVIHQSLAARGASNSTLSRDEKEVLKAAQSLVNAFARGDAEAFSAGLYAPNDSERRLAASYGVAARGIAAFDAALRTRFGNTKTVQRIRYTFSMMSGIPLLGFQSRATDVEVREDQALFRCLELWPSHQTNPLEFLRVNGDWKLVMDIGPRRGTWLSQTVARHEEAARAYEQFAREVREGRYATPEEAWAAWSGSDELPTPAAVTKTP